MPTIFYSEPETDLRYSLVLTDAEASTIADANPRAAYRIVLPTTGGTIEFDGVGGAAITSPKFKHSFPGAVEMIESARRSLISSDDQ
jgi:hypothetical protein